MSQKYDINTKAIGLYRTPNTLNSPDGGLIVGSECFVRRDNVIQRRKGFYACFDGLPVGLPLQLFVGNNFLFTHINNNLYYDLEDCNWFRLNGTSPLLYSPFKMARDGTNIYITESNFPGNNDVRKYDPLKNSLNLFAGYPGATPSFPGTGVGTLARFNSPSGIASDGAGNLYVVDTNYNVIKKIVISTALVSIIAGTGVAGSTNGPGNVATFGGGRGICYDSNTLYVADTTNRIVRKIDLTTTPVTVSTLAGSGAAGSVDGIGLLAEFFAPYGICSDTSFVYVTDINIFGGTTIRKIDKATANVTTIAGNAFTGGVVNGFGLAARFETGSDIISSGGLLYVTDFQVVRVIDKGTIQVSTIAGAPGVSGAVDGIGSVARFSGPTGLLDDVGYVLVADIGNNCIRKVSKASPYNVEKVIGSFSQAGSVNGVNITYFTGPT